MKSMFIYSNEYKDITLARLCIRNLRTKTNPSFNAMGQNILPSRYKFFAFCIAFLLNTGFPKKKTCPRLPSQPTSQNVLYADVIMLCVKFHSEQFGLRFLQRTIALDLNIF